MIAVVLATAACGGSDAVESTTDSTRPATPTTSAEEATTADAAPMLVATVSGGQIDLNSLEGQDTVLWFWAPW